MGEWAKPLARSGIEGSPADISTFPPSRWVAITLDTDFPGGVCRGLWVGQTGNVEVITAYGDTVTIPGVQAGSLLPGFFTRVKQGATTVAEASILAVY